MGYDLFPHQTQFYDKLLQGKRLILNHATGSGKTLTALAAYEFLREHSLVKRALVIVPASLKDNFIENIHHFGFNYSYTVLESPGDFLNVADIYIVSYTYASQNTDLFSQLSYQVIIADEIHKVKNRRSVGYKSLETIFKRSKYILALSASITNNTTEELLALFDLVAGKNLSKQVKDLVVSVKKRLWSKLTRPASPEATIKIKKADKFKSILSPHFDYVDPKEISDITGRPAEIIRYIDVPMSKEQSILYLHALETVGREYLSNFHKGDIKDRELSGFFMRLAAARQTLIDPGYMMNQRGIYAVMDEGKLAQLAKDVQTILNQNPEHSILVFSTFVGFGVKTIKEVLSSIGVSSLIFTGEMTRREKERTTQAFKDRSTSVLVLSAAGAEGLDFPFVSHVIILDPHWNPEVMRQMRSRGVRAGGTSYWNQVRISIYRAKLAGDIKSKGKSIWSKTAQDTVDDWIIAVAERKTNNNILLKQAITGLPRRKITEAFYLIRRLRNTYS